MLSQRLQRCFWMLALLAIAGLCGASFAQQSSSNSTPSKQAQPSAKGEEQNDPLKRELPDKVKKQQAKERMKEMGKTYKKWLDEDVRWIITDEERQAFKQLSNDEERDQFIEAFWQRRDPTPDTEENEYKEEHYARIAYANEHFAAGIPGWKTDRGRIYIMYGKPDSIDSHPAGGTYNRPIEEGGGTTSTYPFETWRYRYIEGIGQEIEIEFVDDCMCGSYEMTIDKTKKDALLHVPGAGLTQYEEMGMASKADRWNNAGLFGPIGNGPGADSLQTKQFDLLEQYAKLNRAPQIKFKDLEEKVTTKIRVNMLAFDVRADFVKITSDTVLVPVTVQVQNRDVTWSNKEGIQRMTVNIFGRMTTLTGKVVQTFEDTVTDAVPEELLPKMLDSYHVYWKALPLKPGRYKLDLALKDVNGDKYGTWTRGIVVPEYSEDKLASSTLILADQMEKVPIKNVQTGMFVIGSTKVRPRVEPASGKPAGFRRNQRVNIWMQVYNLAVDEKTHKPSATIQYDVVNAATNKPVVQMTEKTENMGNVGEQVTLEKSMPLASLDPGIYRVTIKVNDNVCAAKTPNAAGCTITPTARFAVEEAATVTPTSAAVTK